MNLLNIATLNDLNSSSGHLHISCCKCETTVPYRDAMQAGWKYDVDGIRFQSFYCAPCEPLEFLIMDIMTGADYYTYHGDRAGMFKWLQANGYRYSSDVRFRSGVFHVYVTKI